MFFALRELRTARWRFALITGVVLMLSVLVAGLLGLTAGLAHQSVSALRALGSDGSGFVLPADDSGAVDLDRAALTADQVATVAAGDPSAVPVGLARITLDDGTETGVSVVAVGLADEVGSVAPPAPGEVLVSDGVDDEVGADVGVISLGGSALAVAGHTGDLWIRTPPSSSPTSTPGTRSLRAAGRPPPWPWRRAPTRMPSPPGPASRWSTPTDSSERCPRTGPRTPR